MTTTVRKSRPLRKIKDISGRRFGSLTAVSFIRSRCGKHAEWRFRCDCGAEKVALRQAVETGRTTSCGCQTQQQRSESLTKHGMSATQVYKGWAAMKDRCLNPNNTHYAEYGGRGITVCQRWLSSFEDFIADMGPRPPGMTIERKNNDGNYEPDNCKWATRKEQQRNRRACCMRDGFGKRLCISAWAEELGMPRASLVNRLRRGMTIEQIAAQFASKRKSSNG